MSDLKCARLMLRSAERDLTTLDGMAASVPDESFGFHVQQAFEKAFKAWLALLGEIYPLTRDLETLLDRLAACGADAARWAETTRYTPYAAQVRYTGVDPETDLIDRAHAAALVRSLLAAVARALKNAESRTL